MKRALTAVVLSVGLIVLSGPWSVAIADDDDDDNDNRLQAVPATFVGKAGDCGTAYPAGSRIVTSAWLGGMGLPDNGGQNVGSDPKDNPSKQDPHLGLLLSKNGTTADCSAAEAEITGVTGIEVTPTFTWASTIVTEATAAPVHRGSTCPIRRVGLTGPLSSAGVPMTINPRERPRIRPSGRGCGSTPRIPRNHFRPSLREARSNASP